MTPEPEASQGRPATPAWRPWLLAALALLALWGATFHEALSGRGVLDHSGCIMQGDAVYDVPPGPRWRWHDPSGAVNHQPCDRRIFSSFAQGHWPLWMPDVGCGAPLFGDGESAPLSGYKWALIASTGGKWTTAFMLTRHLLAGLGTLALAAMLGLSATAGFVAASGFMLTAFFLYQLEMPAALTLQFLPWMLILAEWLRRAPSPRRIAGTGLAVAAFGLAGHSEAAVTAMFAIGAAYLMGVATQPGRRATQLVAGAAALGLGALLSLVLVLPLLELALNAHSYFYTRHVDAWSFGWKHVLVFASSHLLTPQGMAVSPDFNAHVGLVAAALAPLGLRVAGPRRTALTLLVTCVACWLVLPPVALVRMPGFAPNSFYTPPIFGLGLALLGGAGLDALRARASARAAWILGLGLAGVAAGVAVYQAHASTRLFGDLGAAPLWLAAVSGLVMLAAWKPRSQRLIAPALAGLAAAHLLGAARATYHLSPPFDYPATAPILAHLRATGHEGRVAGGLTALLPKATSIHRLASVEQVSPFQVGRYSTFMATLNGNPTNVALNYRVVQPGFSGALLDVAHVRWLASATDASGGEWLKRLRSDPTRFEEAVRQPRAVLFENKRALPRARMVYRAVTLPPDPARAAQELARDPARWRDQVLLELPDAPADAAVSPGGRSASASSPARIVSERDDALTVEAVARQPGWLVLADTFYPGWVAEVDGAPAPIVPAYVAFRAVAVPAGAHRVTFRYEPASVRGGAAGSLAGLALALALLAWPRRRPRPA